MGLLSIFNSLKNKIACFIGDNDCRNQDKIHLNLDGLSIYMERCFEYDKPHEVSVFVPRAELRKRITRGDEVEEIEILLNSITVVHSPQRPSDEGGGPPPAPPEIPGKSIKLKEFKGIKGKEINYYNKKTNAHR
ncbi:hypothetical protein [Halothermothrix orenii]|uniref:Uncharacterized protein n=1 Tax=Halothermothrix orenii (strain H 168 / OCM 544 / DSM 9562) TaxID=373903 RepID=B8D1U1_HALOH|nr:hypothetical protein [Halothermothrix orenii]ACL69168.1 hypothetical protein Hore_04100 [Halothermothrix orenii H 168]